MHSAMFAALLAIAAPVQPQCPGGLFDGSAWIAQPKGLAAAAPRFTTAFRAEADGPAEIAICGLGQYVASLDGKPLGRGDEFNLPGWTRTSKTCFYNVFRPVLKAGEKYSLEIVLGDGMYNVPHPGKGLYTKFIGSEGGKKLLVGGIVKSSVEGWMVAPSEVVRTHVYAGDDVDHRVENSPVVRAVAAEPPRGKLQEAPFVCRLMETMRPVKVMRAAVDELTVDFGQNAAYVPSVVVKGPRSSRVELEFSEIPLGEGETRITAKSSGYGNAVTRCVFTLAGNGEERFSTPFFYCGFRYMRLRFVPAVEGGELPGLVSAEARVVMADVPRAGSFKCSDELFNKIHDICWWAQRSNMQSVFTDCPHREKLGWQEQDHIHAEQIRWGWNADAMFAKTCMDLADSQLESGLCPDIAPEYTVFEGGFRDSIEWGSSIVQIPWQQYEWSGDDSLIRKHYTNMVAYHRYVRSRANDPRRGRFIAHGGLGDWYEGTGGGDKKPLKTPRELPATVFYYMNAEVLAKCAEMLGRKGEADEFRREAGEIKKAFNDRWWHPESASYASNSQTANAMALASGLADRMYADAIVSNIVADVRERGNAVAAGEIGYPYLLKVLSEYGRSDIVFDMTSDSTKPGYGYMIAKGNTTCHEAWNANPADSHNHFMMADIVNWFYGSLAGIRPTSPGFKTFDVEPQFLPKLDWVEARYKIASGGEIRVDWRRGTRGAISVDVVVPEGTKATVRLPGKPAEEQGPGGRQYSVLTR